MKARSFSVENYIPNGGSVHFPPNARGHYDLDNDTPVLSTIEDWRIGSGPGGKDMARPFTNQAFRRVSGNRPGLHGPVAGVLAAKHAWAWKQAEGRRRQADEELAAISVLLR